MGTAVSVPKGRVIVQLIERAEEHLPELDQVRGRVEQDYRAGQSVVVARERAEELATQAEETGDFKKAARQPAAEVDAEQPVRPDGIPGRARFGGLVGTGLLAQGR